MGRNNTPILSEAQRSELEHGLRRSKNHTFRMRCQTILLKADGRTSKDVGSVVGMCHVSVNSWLKRYNTGGIGGLATKPGRGRKPGLTKEADQQAVFEAIKANRQRISMAKAEWEAQRDKADAPVGRDAFRRFLKSLGADTSG